MNYKTNNIKTNGKITKSWETETGRLITVRIFQATS